MASPIVPQKNGAHNTPAVQLSFTDILERHLATVGQINELAARLQADIEQRRAGLAVVDGINDHLSEVLQNGR